jgi:hypothetical protein
VIHDLPRLVTQHEIGFPDSVLNQFVEVARQQAASPELQQANGSIIPAGAGEMVTTPGGEQNGMHLTFSVSGVARQRPTLRAEDNALATRNHAPGPRTLRYVK